MKKGTVNIAQLVEWLSSMHRAECLVLSTLSAKKAWGHMLITLALEMWTQEDHKFKVMLSYIVSSSPLWDTWHFASKTENRKRRKDCVDICSPQLESVAVGHQRVEIGWPSVNFILRCYHSLYLHPCVARVEPRAWCRPDSSALPPSYVLIPAPENLAQTFHSFRKNKVSVCTLKRHPENLFQRHKGLSKILFDCPKTVTISRKL